MRVAFAGTPSFAATALQALIDAGHDLVLVLTQPDRPAGRGNRLSASPVKQLALRHALPLAQPASLRHARPGGLEGQQALRQAAPEVLVVAAYGLILPQEVLDLPGLGALNIHASLLPRWRGAAPIHRAIEAGDAESGITIMQMDAGLDTGPMLMSRSVPIAPDETTGQLHDRLAALGAELILEALTRAEQGLLRPVPQPLEGVTYAQKISKTEAVLDWSEPAARLACRIRALDPAPGASARIQGWEEAVKVFCPEVLSACGSPGTLIGSAGDLVVACGEGALRLHEIQRPGGRRLPAPEVLRGWQGR